MRTIEKPFPYNKSWENEYRQKGIPSSFRTTPSAAVTWFWENLSFLSGQRETMKTAMEVGCGLGRNALFLAEQGLKVTAFDASSEAIAKAQERNTYNQLTFQQHDLGQGLPGDDGCMDILIDIFVYKHQTEQMARKAYRREISRVLGEDGLFLLSLADKEDGYYSQCPRLSVDSEGFIINDSVVDIQSILFSFDDLQAELNDYFECVLMWRKHSTSPMHGQEYDRVVLTTVWKKK